jgi:hypothetical protein
MLSIILSSAGRACTCPKFPTADKIVANSKNFQRGFVYKLRTDSNFAYFYIKDIFLLKGRKRSVLRTPLHSGSCGAQVSVPGYVWFSFDEKGNFFNCGGVVDILRGPYFDLEKYHLRNEKY